MHETSGSGLSNEDLEKIYEEVRELETRSYFCLSDLEKKILFGLENVGFVRKLTPRVFCLDLSPFSKQTKREIFLLTEDAPPLPEDGTLIEVEVQNEESTLYGAPLRKIVFKKVSSWKKLPLSSIYSPSKKTIERYRADLEIVINSIFPEAFNPNEPSGPGFATAMLLLSSPPTNDVDGGFKTTILGKRSALRSFSKIYSVLPEEVRKKNPKVSFNVIWSNKPVSSKAREDNRHYMMSVIQPPIMTFDAPLSLFEEKIRHVRYDLNELRSVLVPLWTHDPQIDDSNREYMLRKLESIRELILPSLEPLLTPYNASTKFSLAIGRMEFLDIVRRSEIRKAIDLLTSLAEDTIRYAKIMESIKGFEYLSLPAEIVCKTIEELGGEDSPIPVQEVRRECKTLDDDEFKKGIEELRLHGLIIVSRDTIRLIPLRK